MLKSTIKMFAFYFVSFILDLILKGSLNIRNSFDQNWHLYNVIYFNLPKVGDTWNLTLAWMVIFQLKTSFQLVSRQFWTFFNFWPPHLNKQNVSEPNCSFKYKSITNTSKLLWKVTFRPRCTHATSKVCETKTEIWGLHIEWNEAKK